MLETNPLLSDRWSEGKYISSRKLIEGFAKVLRRHYSSSKVRPDGEAVNVRLTQGAGEESDGLGFDIVPAFLLRPKYGGQEFYLIADGADGWMRTNPRLDQEVSDRLQQDNSKTFRKAVKLVKWWNSQYIGGHLKSYYIELAAMRAFHGSNQFGNYITSISDAVTMAFRATRDAVLLGDQASLVTGAPDVTAGDLTNSDVQRLSD